MSRKSIAAGLGAAVFVSVISVPFAPTAASAATVPGSLGKCTSKYEEDAVLFAGKDRKSLTLRLDNVAGYSPREKTRTVTKAYDSKGRLLWTIDVRDNPKPGTYRFNRNNGQSLNKGEWIAMTATWSAPFTSRSCTAKAKVV